MDPKRKNNPYDDLNELYHRTKDLVTGLGDTVSLVRNKADKLSEKTLEFVAPMVSTLEKDLEVWSKSMNELHDKHKTLKGHPKRPNQFIECHVIGTSYFELLEQVSNVGLPLAAEIIGSINESSSEGASNVQ